jgi:hypothetical protein
MWWAAPSGGDRLSVGCAVAGSYMPLRKSTGPAVSAVTGEALGSIGPLARGRARAAVTTSPTVPAARAVTRLAPVFGDDLLRS